MKFWKLWYHICSAVMCAFNWNGGIWIAKHSTHCLIAAHSRRLYFAGFTALRSCTDQHHFKWENYDCMYQKLLTFCLRWIWNGHYASIAECPTLLFTTIVDGNREELKAVKATLRGCCNTSSNPHGYFLETLQFVTLCAQLEFFCLKVAHLSCKITSYPICQYKV